MLDGQGSGRVTMAEIRLTDEQQRQVESLAAALHEDATLRERLTGDPRGVLGEFGLAEVLPPGVEFEVNIGAPEVAGFAFNVHTDTTGHLDDAHLDGTIHHDFAASGFQFRTMPTIGPSLL